MGEIVYYKNIEASICKCRKPRLWRDWSGAWLKLRNGVIDWNFLEVLMLVSKLWTAPGCKNKRGANSPPLLSYYWPIMPNSQDIRCHNWICITQFNQDLAIGELSTKLIIFPTISEISHWLSLMGTRAKLLLVVMESLLLMALLFSQNVKKRNHLMEKRTLKYCQIVNFNTKDKIGFL